MTPKLYHLFEPGFPYLLTMATNNRYPFFLEPKCAQVAHIDIDFYTKKFNSRNMAHIVMPDHVHWVIFPSVSDFEQFKDTQQDMNGKYAHAPERYYLSKIVEDYQRHVAFVVNGIRNARGFKVWQDGFFDKVLRTESGLNNAIRYTLYNAVKDGLVEKLEDYPFVGGEAVDWDFL